MAQNVYLSALETLWALVQEEAGADVERELKGTFQRFLDPTDESTESPFALNDTVSVKRTKLKAAMLETLPDCSTEGKHIMETMFEETDSSLCRAATDVFTFHRAWVSDSDSSDSDSD